MEKAGDVRKGCAIPWKRMVRNEVAATMTLGRSLIALHMVSMGEPGATNMVRDVLRRILNVCTNLEQSTLARL